MKIVLNSILVLIGAALGWLAGDLIVGMKFIGQPTQNRYMMWATIGQGVSDGAFDDNRSDAKDLLQRQLAILQNGMDPRSTLEPSMKKALLLQAALTKARLSILEKRTGNSGRADSYMSAAQADLKSLGWLDYSSAHIERVVLPQRSTTSPRSAKPASAQLPSNPAK